MSQHSNKSQKFPQTIAASDITGLGTAAMSDSGDFAATSHTHGASGLDTDAVIESKIRDGAVSNDKIADGTIVATDKLTATGTTDSTTFLRGDDTWAEPVKPVLRVTLHADGNSNCLVSAAPNSAVFFEHKRQVQVVDASGYTQARISVHVATSSASANTPVCAARYATSYSSTATTYLQMGSSEVAVSVASGGTRPFSSWIDLAAGAKTSIFVAPISLGGDGVASPAVGNIILELR